MGETVLLSFKETMVFPSPQETSLNPNFILGKISGEIVEKMLAFCLQRALNETALTALVDDLWRKQDGDSVSILATFDTISSGCLLDQLQELGIGTLFYAVSQPSLQFVPVSINEGYGEKFVSQLLLCGMPLGSTVSLVMFNYLKPLDKVIQHLEVWYYQYTDDRYPAPYLCPEQPSDAVQVLFHCLGSEESVSERRRYISITARWSTLGFRVSWS